MELNNWLRTNTRRLAMAGIGSARLDCLILLEDASQQNRAWLLAHPEAPLGDIGVKGPTLHKLRRQLRRRAQHEPLAYIRGHCQFYGRRFLINRYVLQPRPESETMIDLLKQFVIISKAANGQRITDNHQLQLIDVGTGSGALAITAKLELSAAEVIAIDIDRKCLSIARRNARALGADVSFYQGDLLTPLLEIENWKLKIAGKSLILLCNLPYVPDGHGLNQAAANEPRLAIFGGPDGLNPYRRLFDSAVKLKPAAILTESLPSQHQRLQAIAEQAGYRLRQTADLIQLYGPREVVGQS